MRLRLSPAASHGPDLHRRKRTEAAVLSARRPLSLAVCRVPCQLLPAPHQAPEKSVDPFRRAITVSQNGSARSLDKATQPGPIQLALRLAA